MTRYEYRAIVKEVHDGDTIVVDVDLGFRQWVHDEHLRLAGLDAPELNTPAGRTSRDWVVDKLPVGTPLTIHTELDRDDKYGRKLATVWVRDDGPWGDSLNSQLLLSGLAKPYYGGKR